ncbi:MAG: hypothetical protein HZB50_01605 [Chloroflexi bacterium]|nr:hypothetical protein [Chloroflexota bacterium]
MKKLQTKKSIEIPSPYKRLNYFSGQFLTQADLQTEQSYFIGKRRLHNIHIFGYGVVSGLNVSVSKDQSEGLTISSGYAIDVRGNELFLPDTVQMNFPKNTREAYLALYWAERESDFVPAQEGSIASRVEEFAILKYVVEDPSRKLKTKEKINKHDGILLARLLKVREVWKLDKKIRVRRVKP